MSHQPATEYSSDFTTGTSFKSLRTSVTGIKTNKGHERASAIPKDLYPLISEAVALRKHFSMYMIDKDPESGLRTVKKIIDSVSGYHEETKHLRRGWEYNKAIALALVSGLTPSDNGMDFHSFVTFSYGSYDLYLLIKKAVAIRKHLETNKNDNDSKLKLISAERRIRYLACMHKNNKHLPRRWKYNPVTASTIFLTEKGLAPSQSGAILPDSQGKGSGCHQPPPLNPNRKVPNMYRVPLKDEDHKSWLKFRNLDQSTEAKSKLLEAAKLHAHLEGNTQQPPDLEFMECNYLKNTKGYYFYMTIEAIEEGNLGIYEAEVLCNSDDGSRTLSKFVLTDRTPVGKKAMAISYLSRLRSICNAVEGLTDSKVVYILSKYRHRNAGLTLQRSLQTSHDKTMKGLGEVLSQDTQPFFSLDYNQTTNQDDWSNPSPDFYSGMVRRTNGTTCMGYDYYNPFDIDTLLIGTV
ncbi:40S ribosomal protein S13 [Tanacetum coccineum]